MGLYFIIVVAMFYVLLDWSLVYLIIVKTGFVVCIVSALIFIGFAWPKLSITLDFLAGDMVSGEYM